MLLTFSLYGTHVDIWTFRNKRCAHRPPSGVLGHGVSLRYLYRCMGVKQVVNSHSFIQNYVFTACLALETWAKMFSKRSRFRITAIAIANFWVSTARKVYSINSINIWITWSKAAFSQDRAGHYYFFIVAILNHGIKGLPNMWITITTSLMLRKLKGKKW